MREYDGHGGYYVPLGEYSKEGEKRARLNEIRSGLDETTHRYCSTCEHVRVIDHFHIDKHNKSGRRYKCMFCFNEKQRKPGSAPKPVVEVRGDEQKCTKCKKWKNKSEFGKNPSIERGTYSLCKKCHSKARGYKEQRKFTEISEDREWKVCCKCGEWRHIDDYSYQENGLLKRHTNCKPCEQGKDWIEYLLWKIAKKSKEYLYKYERKEKQKKREKEKDIEWQRKQKEKRISRAFEKMYKVKFCSVCGVVKSLIEFHKNGAGPYGVVSACKECKSRKSDEKKEMDRRQKEAYKRGEHICLGCGSSRPLNEFSERKDHIFGVANVCKICAVEIERKRMADPEKMEKRNEKRREKYRTDEIFRKQMIIRADIKNRLMKDGPEMINKYLGCTNGFFIKHLNSTSEEFNYGDKGVDLDHIIPVSKAKTINELCALNKWPNWQLLSSNQNRSKNDALPVRNLLHPRLSDLALEVYEREVKKGRALWGI